MTATDLNLDTSSSSVLPIYDMSVNVIWLLYLSFLVTFKFEIDFQPNLLVTNFKSFIIGLIKYYVWKKLMLLILFDEICK
jgi:hypothetical protein